MTSRLEEYIKFYKELENRGIPKDATIRGISETAARPLIRIRDGQVREKALSSIAKALESGKHPLNGKFS